MKNNLLQNKRLCKNTCLTESMDASLLVTATLQAEDADGSFSLLGLIIGLLIASSFRMPVLLLFLSVGSLFWVTFINGESVVISSPLLSLFFNNLRPLSVRPSCNGSSWVAFLVAGVSRRSLQDTAFLFASAFLSVGDSFSLPSLFGGKVLLIK